MESDWRPTTDQPPVLHESIAALLEFFEFKHLPEHLQEVSKPFCRLAYNVAHTLRGPEATVCIRKLLEAKDCAVRAKLTQDKR